MATPDTDTPTIEQGAARGNFPQLAQTNAIDTTPPRPPSTTHAFLTASQHDDTSTMRTLIDKHSSKEQVAPPKGYTSQGIHNK
jgi:hypothetical protein